MVEVEAAIDPSKVGEEPPLALLRVSSEVLRAPFKGLGGLWGGSSGPPWTPARLSLRAGMAGGGLKKFKFLLIKIRVTYYSKFEKFRLSSGSKKYLNILVISLVAIVAVRSCVIRHWWWRRRRIIAFPTRQLWRCWPLLWVGWWTRCTVQVDATYRTVSKNYNQSLIQ